MTVHRPVMLKEVLAALSPRDGGFYIDGTFGGGGYTSAILEAAECTVLGLDRDEAAIKRGNDLQARYGSRLVLSRTKFSAMEDAASALGRRKADGVALDLGLSSDQLEEPDRGFSFSTDGPLDMRMGREGPTAADLVNNLSEAALAAVLTSFGEEPRARAIGRAIVGARESAPITRTTQLVSIVEKVVGSKARVARIHPATRTFQALRIAVNGELLELAEGLAAAERLLATDGTLAVVAFHSLEDRIVKRFFSTRGTPARRPSRHAPESGDTKRAPSFRLLYRQAKRPAPAEIARNPRSRSARLRAAMRLAVPAHPFNASEIAVPRLAFDGALP